MSTHIFQAVWPIVDNSVSPRDRIAAATADITDLARQAHAQLTGPPVWQVLPADQVPGFTAYAPGRVLIGRAPARPAAKPAVSA